MSIQWPGGQVEAVEFSVSHAFASAREQLEPLRLMLPGACLSCIGGVQDDEANDLTDESSWNSGGRIGSLPSINSIAANAAMQIYFDFLAERIQHSFWQRISWNGAQGLTASANPVSGKRNCEICGVSERIQSGTE